MPHYAFAPRQKPTSGEVGKNVADSLTSAIGIYMQGKEKEESQRKQEESLATIQSPQASNLQKAIAWGNINPKVQEQLIKQEQQQQKQALVERILTQGQSQQMQTPQSDAIYSGQQPVEQMNKPEQFNQNAMQTPSRVPNVNEMRQQLENMFPTTGATPPIVPRTTMNAPQQMQQDPLDEKRAELARKQKQAEMLSGIDNNIASKISSQAHELAADIRGEEKNRAIVEAANIKAQTTLEKEKRKEIRQFHEESKPFYEKLSTDANQARHRGRISQEVRSDIRKGKLDPKNLSNFLANKFRGTLLEGMFSSAERAKIEAAQVYFMDGMREMFGGVMSTAKLQLAAKKIISPEKTPEANLAIMDLRDFQDNMKIRENEIANEILKENNDVRPPGFQRKVQEKLEAEYAPIAQAKLNLALSDGITEDDFVNIQAPDGRVFRVDAEKVPKKLALGGRILKNDSQ